MPDLDELFAENRGARPEPFAAQCFEAVVSRVTGAGAMVTIPSFDWRQEWGPCLPSEAIVEPGQRVAVLLSQARRPWLVGVAIRHRHDSG